MARHTWKEKREKKREREAIERERKYLVSLDHLFLEKLLDGQARLVWQDQLRLPLISGLGVRVHGMGLGFGVWGLGFRVWGLGFRVFGTGSRVQGFEVWI